MDLKLNSTSYHQFSEIGSLKIPAFHHLQRIDIQTPDKDVARLHDRLRPVARIRPADDATISQSAELSYVGLSLAH